MRIKFLVPMAGVNKAWSIGDEDTFPNAEAKRLVAHGIAEEVKPATAARSQVESAVSRGRAAAEKALGAAARKIRGAAGKKS